MLKNNLIRIKNNTTQTNFLSSFIISFLSRANKQTKTLKEGCTHNCGFRLKDQSDYPVTSETQDQVTDNHSIYTTCDLAVKNIKASVGLMLTGWLRNTE